MLKKISTSLALLILALTTSACTMSLDRFGQLISPSIGDDDPSPAVSVIKGTFPLGQPAFNLQHKSFLSAAPGNKFVGASLFDHKIYVFTAEGKTLKSIDLPVAAKWPDGDILSLGVDSTGLVYVGLAERIAGSVVREYILKYDLDGVSQGLFKEFTQENGMFPSAQDITFDASNNVYLGMNYFYQIRKYNRSTGAQMAAYGAGTSGSADGEFWGAPKFTLDSSGNVYAVDDWSDRIQKFLPTGGFDSKFTWPTQILPVAPAVVAYSNVKSLKLLSNGNFLISQSDSNGYLISFDPTGALLFITDGSAGATQFTSSPVVFAEAGNEVYVMNSSTTRVYNKITGALARKYDPTLSNALGLARDTLGNTYVSDMGGIKRFDTTGFSDLSFAAGTMMYDIDIDSQGIIYGSNLLTGKIMKYNPDGTSAGEITPTGTTYFLDIVYDKTLEADVIYQTDATNGVIRKLTTAGVEIGTIGAGQIISPISVAATSDGGVIVSDAQNTGPGAPFRALVKINPDNSVAWTILPGAAGNITTILGIAVDKDGSILAADAAGNKIVRFSADGAHMTTYGQAGAAAGEFTMPIDIMVDAGSNFYVSEAGNSRVQKFNSSGVVQAE
ncbi:NHL repeat-containing protein [Bdellovibrio bacteriovorus]|uniref:NHL repeat-containing protein n=1 Tax=Bdellovibrio bacteriovorus TaxID=959 RepID=UPI0035A6BF89